MSFQLIEGDLCFDFDDRWAPILAWDRHAAYRRGINEIDNSSAVDIVGVYGGKTLYFIEVKDYRVHPRTKPIDPRRELDSKVRNTVAGLLGACRREEHVAACAPFVDAIRDLAVKFMLDISEDARRHIESCLNLRELERWLEQSNVVGSTMELFDARK